MTPLMRLSCTSLYVAIKILSTSAEVFLGRRVRGQPGERHSIFFCLLQSLLIRQTGLRIDVAVADEFPRKHRVGRGLGLKEHREERSAEALTGDIPDHSVCLAWSMQCSLILRLFLIPDGEIASSVVLTHSKSLEGRVWIPVNTAPLSVVLFSLRLVEGRWREEACGHSVE